MGKLNYINDKDGYEFISNKGIKYELLEGISYKGTSTSDRLFILLSFDEELIEKVNHQDYVGYIFGAEFVERYTDEYIEIIDKMVNKYEKKMNL